jgi:hypothetical protein
VKSFGEKFQAERMVNDVEVAVISENEMLSLSPRVGVLFVPERLAAVLFTCFVSANLQRVLYKKPALPAPATTALEDQTASKADTLATVARPPRPRRQCPRKPLALANQADQPLQQRQSKRHHGRGRRSQRHLVFLEK